MEISIHEFIDLYNLFLNEIVKIEYYISIMYSNSLKPIIVHRLLIYQVNMYHKLLQNMYIFKVSFVKYIMEPSLC